MKNQQIISEKKAIFHGHIRVTLPVYALLVIPFGVAKYLFNSNQISGLLLTMITFFALSSAWLWWSYFIVKWKLWAYDKVEDVSSLKIRAVKNSLIWPENSWFNKTEIWRASDKERLKKINKKHNIQ